MRIILITLLAVSLFSCSQKKGITSTSAETAQDEATIAVADTEVETPVLPTYRNDCFKDRAATKSISGQKASMVFVMNTYMFAFENTRWQPCAVPEEFQVEGLKVKVSGEVLEIKSNERRAGTPFNINKLEKM